jgi:hypothetical protein
MDQADLGRDGGVHNVFRERKREASHVCLGTDCNRDKNCVYCSHESLERHREAVVSTCDVAHAIHMLEALAESVREHRGIQSNALDEVHAFAGVVEQGC